MIKKDHYITDKNGYVYFKAYQDAQTIITKKQVKGKSYENSYQYPNDCKTLKIVSFGLGWAIQYGDCGDYMTEIELQPITQG